MLLMFSKQMNHNKIAAWNKCTCYNFDQLFSLTTVIRIFLLSILRNLLDKFLGSTEDLILTCPLASPHEALGGPFAVSREHCIPLDTPSFFSSPGPAMLLLELLDLISVFWVGLFSSPGLLVSRVWLFADSFLCVKLPGCLGPAHIASSGKTYE